MREADTEGGRYGKEARDTEVWEGDRRQGCAQIQKVNCSYTFGRNNRARKEKEGGREESEMRGRRVHGGKMRLMRCRSRGLT